MQTETTLIHEKTKNWIKAYAQTPNNPVILDTAGDFMYGQTVAAEIVKTLGISNSKVEQVFSGKLGIEDIRSVKNRFSLQANKSKENEITRMLIIGDGSSLSVEAQNAFLKLLEEMPNNTGVILIVSNMSALLPTVQSRCFYIPLIQVGPGAIKQNYPEKTDSDINRALLQSQGSTTKALEILNDEYSNEMIDQAKTFITSSVYERQLQLKDLHTSKPDYISFIDSLALIARSGMQHAKSTNNKMLWKDRLTIILNAAEQLKLHVSPKLVLLSLSVEL